MSYRVKIQQFCKSARRVLATLLIATVASIAFQPASAISSEFQQGGARVTKSASGPWAKSRILVAPNAGLPDAEFGKILKSHGGKSLGRIAGLDVHVVQVPLNANEDAIARAIAKNPHIKFAEVDGIVTPTAITNDPSLSSEWHIAKIGAESAWDSSTGAGIVVAVIDTGVQSSHPDLSAHLVPGWNAYNNNTNTEDVYGHGTAVAGAVGAVGNNAIGDAGVAFNAKIMPIRITDSSANTTFSIMASGLTWAADHGADVANISFGNVYKSSTMITAAQYLRNKGGEVVVAANNNAVNEGTANTDSMITVSATDQNDNLASFSSYGPMVDVAAPGVTIYTTLWNSGYGWGSGTSFAAPVTSGVVALIMAANPALAPSQVETALFTTAKDLGAAGDDIYFGWGRVNAAAAVLAAKGMTAGDTTPPSVSILSPTSGTLSGIVPVSVGATDNIGVTKVELYAGGVLVAADTTSPYSFSWDTTKVSNATYSLVAKAYDLAGNVATSPSVSVAVSNVLALAPTADTTAPVAKVSNPLNGSKVSGNVSVNVSATDNVGVANLALYIDNVLKSSGNVSSFSYSWNTRKIAVGTHTIKAVAKDAAGNLGTTSISVTK